MASSNNNAAAIRKLGRAEGTIAHDKSAMKLWYAYRNVMQLPRVMHPDEIKGEKLQEYMLILGNFLANRPIAHYFNENLEPTNMENLKCLLPNTLGGYIGKFLVYIRTEIDPDHTDFANIARDDYPSWYTVFRAEFKGAAHRFQLRHVGDEIFEGHDIKEMYVCNDNEKAANTHAKCDVKNVIISLFKEANPQNGFIEKAAQIVDTADAVGRPGEGKYCNFAEWSYNQKMNCPNTPWAQSKTLKKSGMCRICDESFFFDWFCVMGCYFMCDGLTRSNDQIRKGQMNCVFPKLQDGSNNNVSKQLKDCIRLSLAKIGVPEDICMKYTAKSLRKGMITQIAMASDITLFMVCARTGHSTGFTVDTYLDDMHPLRSLPAANALHGNVLNMKPVMPDINAVGEGNRGQVDKLMDELFAVDVPLFQRGGELRIILEHCFAAMVRHLPEMLRLCGGHCLVVSTLFKAADRIGLTDARFPDKVGRLVLLEWARFVADDYKKKFLENKLNAMGPSTQDHGVMFKMLSQIADDVSEMKEKNTEQELELANQKAIIACQAKEIESLKAELQKERNRAKNLVSQLYSPLSDLPTTHATAKRKLQDDATRTSLNFDDAASPAPSVSDVAVPRAAAPAPVAPAPAAPARAPSVSAAAVPRVAAPAPVAAPARVLLAYSNESKQVAEGTGVAGERLKDILLEMSNANMLDGDELMKSRYPQRLHHIKASLYRCLELVQYAGNELDLLDLVGTDADERRHAAADRLETSAQEKLLEFEGLTIAINENLSRPKSTYITGMDTRIKKYKAKIWEAKGELGEKYETPFIEKDALRELEKSQQKTPPGYKNVTSFFN